MANFKLIIAMIIAALLQLCTTNPVSVEDENDATKLFTETQLQRAEAIGLTQFRLMKGHKLGLTFDEMEKIYSIKETNSNTAEVNELCSILLPEHKAATSYTSEQESLLNDMMEALKLIPVSEKLIYFRKYVCVWWSEPSKYEMEAESFGMQVKPYLKFSFIHKKNQNASGMERVRVAKQLCTIYKKEVTGQDDNSSEATFSDLSDEEMNKFVERWMAFETTQTSQSFESVCDFLKARNAAFSTVA